MNNQSLMIDLSELAQDLTRISAFMQQRADTRRHLMANKLDTLTTDIDLSTKNSLSKNSQKQNIKTKDNHPQSITALQQLIQKIAEQINEGHTILTLDTKILEHHQLYEALKNSEWVHILSHHATTIENPAINIAIKNTDKPIIMQVIAEEKYINGEGGQIHASQVVVWFHRQWFAERQLASQLLEIAHRPVSQLVLQQSQHTITSATQNSQKTANQQQQLAIKKACQYALSIITGGPGTGKTFTVAQLVIALQHAHDEQKKINPYLPPLSIALTAPTGKAAQRMQESLSQNLQGQKIELDDAKTLHRLLGIGSNGMPRYHHDNPLPDDLVIVDEASMLGLELASQLVDAIKPTGRLILLGDANQLAAVDAGSVLADLCEVEVLQPYRTELTESRRFDDTSAIGQIAMIIKQSAHTLTEKKQKISTVKKLLNNKPTKHTDIRFYKIQPVIQNLGQHTRQETISDFQKIYHQLGEPYSDFFAITKSLLGKPILLEGQSSTLEQLFQAFDKYRILSAGHHGLVGDVTINQVMSQFHKRKILNLPMSDSYFYHGQPIMILKNDYQLGLFNGDIGICLLVQTQENQPNQLMAFFADKVIEISRLNAQSCSTAYAMTIHKSQGSEFSHVAVCLDNQHTRLLSQELIYTAVTRSKQKLDIYSNEMVLNNAIVQKGNRQTGLTLQFN